MRALVVIGHLLRSACIAGLLAGAATGWPAALVGAGIGVWAAPLLIVPYLLLWGLLRLGLLAGWRADRRRTAAALLVALVGLAGLVLAVQRIGLGLADRVQDVTLLPPALALLILVMGVALTALGVVAARGLAQLPTKWLLFALPVVGGGALVWAATPALRALAKGGGIDSALILAGALLVGGVGLRRWGRRDGLLSTVVIGLAAVLACVPPGRIDPGVTDDDRLPGKVVTWVRVRLDGDGDGFSRALDGGDCDDSDPTVHPLAFDLPANGVDEDCVGGDARALAPPEPTMARHHDLGDLQKRWNLLLISVDALRADHLKAYGYGRETAPNITRLAQRGLIFERAYTPAGTTRAALPAIFAGRALADIDRDVFGRHDVVRPGNNLLFERLKAGGWRTEAHLPLQLVRGMWFGLRAGVDRWRSHPDARIELRSAPTLGPAVAEVLRALPNEPPWALWVHLLEPHEPYLPGPTAFGPTDLDRYDDEIHAADAAIGQMLAVLKATRADRRTLVVIFADHGEEFGEHQRRFHGKQLFEESVRVPWIVHVPTLSTSVRVPHPVSLIDLPETLADLMGLAPGDGVSQAGILVHRPAPPRPVFVENSSESWRLRDREAALITADGKAIFKPRAHRLRRFDLAADPGEATALPGGALGDQLRAEVQRQDAAVFARLLERSRASAPPTGPPVEIAPGLEWLGGKVDAQILGGRPWFLARGWFRATARLPDYLFRFSARQGDRRRAWTIRPLAGTYPTGRWAVGERVEVRWLLDMRQRRGRHHVELTVLNSGGAAAFGPVHLGIAEPR